jgi:ubiquinone/menaquinone biosynthesis C-methylase UbiE
MISVSRQESQSRPNASSMSYGQDVTAQTNGFLMRVAVANPLFTLGELHRVLKPGGTLVLSLPKQNSALVSQSVGELVRYRIHHLERRTPGKILLVILKSFGDRFSHNPRWTRPQAQEMMRVSGFRVISLDEGRQILVVAEQVAA